MQDEAKKTAKMFIIRLFLEFVLKCKSRPVPPVVATLGGEGLEAALWSSYQIPQENGWLIECDGVKGRHLIRQFLYRYCDKLESFPDIYVMQRGSQGIDGFHLDLCGTFEKVDDVFGPIVPLVMKSDGRSFAITVADQRKNQSTDDFPSVYALFEGYVGEVLAKDMYEMLHKEHSRTLEASTVADPDLIVKREIGVAVTLVKLLHEMQAYELDCIERYQYISDTYGGAFRMRTYFFHFAKKGSGRRKRLDPRQTLELWVKSPLRKVTSSGVVDIGPTGPQLEPPTDGGKQKGKTMKFDPKLYPALAGMLTHASVEVMADFDRLMESMSGSSELADELVALLAKHGVGDNPKRAAKKVSKDETSPKTFPGERFGTTDKNVAVKLLLLEAAATCDPGQNERAKELAAKYLGISKSDNKGNILGAHLVRTKGVKFRPLFVKSVLERTPSEQHEAVLSMLANSYSALGSTMDKAALIEEAVQAGYTAD